MGLINLLNAQLPTW